MSTSLLPTAWVTDQAFAHLEAMADTGLWGEGISEVVAHLIYRGVQDALAKGLIEFPEPAVEPYPHVDEAPAVEAPLGGKPPCEGCNSGIDFPKRLSLDGETCADCGRDFTPF